MDVYTLKGLMLNMPPQGAVLLNMVSLLHSLLMFAAFLVLIVIVFFFFFCAISFSDE